MALETMRIAFLGLLVLLWPPWSPCPRDDEDGVRDDEGGVRGDEDGVRDVGLGYGRLLLRLLLEVGREHLAAKL